MSRFRRGVTPPGLAGASQPSLAGDHSRPAIRRGTPRHLSFDRIHPVASGNPNLLLWTEEMDNAVWTKVVVTVTPNDAASPNPPGDGSSTADLCAWVGANRSLIQASSVAGTAGSASSTFVPSATWNRESVTTAIDGQSYTASVYIQDSGALGNQLRLFLEASGGFIRVRLFSVGSVTAHVWGWQLEPGATPSAYQKREGV